MLIKINEDGIDGEKEDYKGTGASTTGNIYGIYDMNGGANEYLLANYGNLDSESGFPSGWLENPLNKKYFDCYSILNPFEYKSKETTGGAFYEIKGWYNNFYNTFDNTYTWRHRGGYYGNFGYSGIFHSNSFNGDGGYYHSFRITLM